MGLLDGLIGAAAGAGLAIAATKLIEQPDELCAKLSQFLPQAVDHLTPNGAVPPHA